MGPPEQLSQNKFFDSTIPSIQNDLSTPYMNTDLQTGICISKAHKTMQGAWKKRKILQHGIFLDTCVFCLFIVVFA